jgi:hypothetical protein
MEKSTVTTLLALAVLGVTTDGGDVVGSWPERSVEYLPWPDRRRLGGR